MIITKLMAPCGFSYWPLLAVFLLPAENVNFAMGFSKTTLGTIAVLEKWQEITIDSILKSRDNHLQLSNDSYYYVEYLGKNSIFSFIIHLSTYPSFTAHTYTQHPTSVHPSLHSCTRHLLNSCLYKAFGPCSQELTFCRQVDTETHCYPLSQKGLLLEGVSLGVQSPWEYSALLRIVSSGATP